VIYLDTGRCVLAVAGDPNLDLEQGFSAIIIDKEGWVEHQYDILPDPSKGKTDEKKLLGACYENVFSEMIALAPKNYSMLRVKRGPDGKILVDKPEKSLNKGKGVDMRRNPELDITKYEECLIDGEPKMGKNAGFHLRTYEMVDQQPCKPSDLPVVSQMVRLFVYDEVGKVTLPGIHTKGVTLPNNSCPPFVEGLTADDYICEAETD
jgi:hypothetical protein